MCRYMYPNHTEWKPRSGYSTDYLLYKPVSIYVTHHGLASYPGLLTPVFVACSTNTGGGLVKLITYNDVPGCWVGVEEWHIPRITASK